MKNALEPFLHNGTFVFACVPDPDLARDLRPVASIQESEGVTVVVPEDVALRKGLDVLFRAAWISLRMPSELDDVGLTAAFSSALAQAGIPCNVVAGAYHDHIFVRIDTAELAMDILRDLSLG
jgi:hypothetical protein